MAVVVKKGVRRQQVAEAQDQSASEDQSRPAVRVVKKSEIVPEKPDMLFDSKWYLQLYGTHVPAGKTSFEHYMETGWQSGYMPNMYFDPKWYFENHMVGKPFTNPLVHYCEVGAKGGYSVNCIVDPDYLQREYGNLGMSVLRFLVAKKIDRPCEWFSRSSYLKMNPDVTGWDRAPETHFFLFGINNGRQIAPGIKAEPKSARTFSHDREARVYEKAVGEFTLNGTRYVVSQKVVSDAIVAQIMNQAAIEPDVASVGHQAVPYLPQFRATETNRRNLIDYRALLKAIPIECDAIVILPAIQMGGAERYAANLVWGLQHAGLTRCLLLTTDAWAADDRNSLSLGIFSRLSGVHHASLREIIKGSWQADTILALLLQRTKAKHLFVVNSDLGLQTVRSHGKALATRMSISCAFFSESPNAVGAPYSVRYMTDILPISNVLSDNRAAVDKWRGRYNGLYPDRFVVIPTLIDDISSRMYHIISRANVARRSENSKRLLWFSRWEKFKAVDVLQAIALQLEDVSITAYGSVDASFANSKLPRNLRHEGVMSDINDVAFENFGVFVFTSYFEGLPNVVLEMAHRGIPIVASDVGGLRETFGSGEIDLISMEGDKEAVASRFVAAIERIWEMSDDDVLARMDAARRAVEARHGRSQFIENVADLTGRA